MVEAGPVRRLASYPARYLYGNQGIAGDAVIVDHDVGDVGQLAATGPRGDSGGVVEGDDGDDGGAGLLGGEGGFDGDSVDPELEKMMMVSAAERP